MITEFTPEQKAQLSIYAKKWQGFNRRTRKEDDYEAGEEAIKEVYVRCGLKPPEKIYWVENPKKAIDLAVYLLKKERPSDCPKDKLIQSVVEDACWCIRDEWAKFDYFQNVIGLDLKVDAYVKLASCCMVYYPFDTCVIMVPRPTVIKFDEEGRLHCDDGPAMKFDEDFVLYYTHGVNDDGEEWKMKYKK